MTVPLSRYIQVNITAGTRSVARAGFGVPLLLAYFPTTIFTTRTKLYSGQSGLADMVTDGFVTSDPAYYMAQAVLSQNPRVEEFIVGRMANPAVLDYDLTVSNTTDTISVTILGNGTEETFSMTGTGVAANDATTLAGLINAGTLGAANRISAGAAGAVITISPGAAPITGLLLYFSDITRANLAFDDQTPDPGIAADITPIRAENDDGYCWLYEGSSGAQNTVIATTVETAEKTAIVQSQDDDIPAGTAGNLAEVLQAASRERTNIIFSVHGMHQYPACAMAGRALPYLPGQYTLAYKPLSGVTADTVLVTAEAANIETQNANWYKDWGGVGGVFQGIMPDGGWYDQIQLTDWLREEIRIRLVNALINNDKIPYTDDAGELAKSEISGAYELGAQRGGFVVEDFACSYTPAASQTVADRAARIFNGVEFGGTFAGAAHQFRVSGRVV